MKYFIVSGSTRENSQSYKVSTYLMTILESMGYGVNSHILDLAIANLPLWNENLWDNRAEWDKTWLHYSNLLSECDAIIIVTPEWGGMVPAALKNFFLLCSNLELFHKPALIISISSGNNGAYPIAEIRMSSYKNTKICYIPEHIIIRDVESVLNNFRETQNEYDAYIQERIIHTMKILNVYASCFRPLRGNEIICSNKYIYGM